MNSGVRTPIIGRRDRLERRARYEPHVTEGGRLDPAAYRLIAITDDLRDGTEGLVARAAAAARGGATMVQLRLKHTDARTLADVGRALVTTLGVPVIVNDRLDVALACGAAGVHVGADDLPVAVVRRLAPPGFVIGTSVGSVDEAAQAAGGGRAGSGRGVGADYAGVGPVFGSGSKLDAGEAIGLGGLKQLAALAGLPAVAIGGITANTAAQVLATGVVGVAVIGAIFGGPDPEAAARSLRAAIDRAVPHASRDTDSSRH
jgi:thiamine-phosphate pyrophosphorylase